MTDTPQPFVWTDTAIAQLRKLAKEGLPGRVIAQRIGCSRGAVSGKAHRLGIKLLYVQKINPKPVEWTPDRIAEFTRRWTNIEPLDVMARDYKMTIRSIRRVAWRFGLTSRKGMIRQAAKTAVAKPVRIPVAAVLAPVVMDDAGDTPGPYSAPSWTLPAHACQWPYGEKPRGRMDEIVKCGAPAEGAYCGYHQMRAMRPKT